MTIEEKRQAIEDYCNSKQNCTTGQKYPCPLYALGIDAKCYGGANDEEIERNFALVSVMPDYIGNKEVINDSVNHPTHYTNGGIECIDAMEAAFGKEAVSNFCICNAFKYLFRHNLKNGKEDIEKAEWYLTKYKELKYVE